MDRRLLIQAVKAALPIGLGYIALGLPSGILCAVAGMNVLEVFALALIMYSGSGQYMIPNMFMAGVPTLTLSATVTLVSSRQLLYGSALSPFFAGVNKLRLFWFASTVTDESFGVNLARFQMGKWTPAQAQAVNTFSHFFWTASNVAGVLIGSWLVIDTAIASFAMTSIFLCLLLMQKFSPDKVVAVAVSVAGVVLFKVIGLSGLAILCGALLGVAAGMLVHHFTHGDGEDDKLSSGAEDGAESIVGEEAGNATC